MRVHLAIVGGDSIEKCVVEYVHGGGTMLPGLEAVLLGKEQGAKLDGVLKAKEAFGNPSMHPVKKIPRAEFPKDANLKVGEKFSAKGGPDGKQDVVMVIEKVTDIEVDVALVHPLADKDIKYEVEVLSVKEVKAPPPIPMAALELEEAPE